MKFLKNGRNTPIIDHFRPISPEITKILHKNGSNSENIQPMAPGPIFLESLLNFTSNGTNKHLKQFLEKMLEKLFQIFWTFFFTIFRKGNQRDFDILEFCRYRCKFTKKKIVKKISKKVGTPFL